MRIAIMHFDIRSKTYGGVERVLEEMSKYLSKKYDVTVVFPSMIPDFLNLGKAKKLKVFRRNYFGYRFNFLLPKLGAWFIARKLNEYDCVILNHSLLAPIGRFLKTKSVYYCHEPTRGLFEEGFKRKESLLTRFLKAIPRYILKSWELKGAKNVDLVIANSYYTKECIWSSYGVNAVVVYPGVDLNFFKSTNSKKKNYVITVGRLDPSKRFDIGIEAVKNVDTKLFIVGKERTRKDLRK